MAGLKRNVKGRNLIRPFMNHVGYNGYSSDAGSVGWGTYVIKQLDLREHKSVGSQVLKARSHSYIGGNSVGSWSARVRIIFN